MDFPLHDDVHRTLIVGSCLCACRDIRTKRQTDKQTESQTEATGSSRFSEQNQMYGDIRPLRGLSEAEYPTSIVVCTTRLDPVQIVTWTISIFPVL